jgi:hypothetical protein
MYKSEMRTRTAKAMQKINENNGDESLDNLINIS